MSAGEIRVDADLIQQHASRVEQLASDAAEAVSAINSINLSGGAFGLLCAWMVPPVSMLSGVVSSAISGGEDLIGRTATEIRAALGEFDQYEESVTQSVANIEKALG
ncbi:hypothetical protein LQ938_11520 [Microbacterium sp. cx-55]|uniref:type VII secretion target n=1 Tax=Microbacterium sp. cx-55 TaxID=2875948 RepID=UPI001CBCB1FE|nr:type VII secretion target [Microbacterium sp. cx-55]MBZ4488096.1 hypothetical protein [Microbacterium sp. cx-55]UGB34495.1 hypothetical protein LQ938_11520 [Microbacterium sp. cx-55]